MSTANDIVRRGLRLIGVLSSGKEPTGADAQDGLERLQSIVLGLPGLLLNGRWRDVQVPGDFTAREGDRCTMTGPGVVTLPGTVTCDGYTRPPRDMAKVQIVADVGSGLWLYSATNGVWGRVDGLTLESDMPFGQEDDDNLSALLAVNMADEYGAAPSDRTVSLAKQAIWSLRSRLKKAEPTDWSRPDASGPLTISDGQFCDYGSDS